MMFEYFVSQKKLNWLLLICFLFCVGGCATNVRAPVESRGANKGSKISKTEQRRDEDLLTQSRPGYYIVKKGDTLFSIAKTFGQTVSDIAIWNKLESNIPIEIGQELRVLPPEGAVVSQIVTPPPPLVVKKGEVMKADQSQSGISVKTGPLGGSQPYSEQAWKAASENQKAEPQKLAKSANVITNAEQAAEKSDAGAQSNATEAEEVNGVQWQWPVQGKVLKKFNETSSKGIDINGKLGDSVFAAADGKVIHVGSVLRGYGNLVIVKHGKTYLSAYAHNKEILVKEGQVVKRGQKIAVLGNSDADRPMLHFEIRQQGKPVDPMKFLPNS